jgi:DNA-directed RNA polymerase specialized sigma24 family protein
MGGGGAGMAFSNWSDAEWRNWDCREHVMEVAPKVTDALRRHSAVRAYMEPEDVLHEFFVFAYPALKRAHERNLDLVGSERNRLVCERHGELNSAEVSTLLGGIAASGARDENPASTASRRLGALLTDDSLFGHLSGDAVFESLIHAVTHSPANAGSLLAAAPMSLEPVLDEEEITARKTQDELRLVRNLERIRHNFNTTGYRVLWWMVVDGLEAHDIAERLQIPKHKAFCRMSYVRKQLRRLGCGGAGHHRQRRQHTQRKRPAQPGLSAQSRLLKETQ